MHLHSQTSIDTATVAEWVVAVPAGRVAVVAREGGASVVAAALVMEMVTVEGKAAGFFVLMYIV